VIENNNPEDGISSDMRSNGLSVWPLSSEQLEIIRGFFTIADNMVNLLTVRLFTTMTLPYFLKFK
jgi:hypothetical protein